MLGVPSRALTHSAAGSLGRRVGREEVGRNGRKSVAVWTGRPGGLSKQRPDSRGPSEELSGRGLQVDTQPTCMLRMGLSPQPV